MMVEILEAVHKFLEAKLTLCKRIMAHCEQCVERFRDCESDKSIDYVNFLRRYNGTPFPPSIPSLRLIWHMTLQEGRTLILKAMNDLSAKMLS